MTKRGANPVSTCLPVEMHQAPAIQKGRSVPTAHALHVRRYRHADAYRSYSLPIGDFWFITFNLPDAGAP